MKRARIKWTEEMVATLKECASAGLTALEASKVLKISDNSTYYRARKLDLNFNSDQHADLRQFLAAGGRLIREDFGGAIGVRWSRAHRSGSAFATAICETLLKYGVLVHDGRTYRRAA